LASLHHAILQVRPPFVQVSQRLITPSIVRLTGVAATGRQIGDPSVVIAMMMMVVAMIVLMPPMMEMPMMVPQSDLVHRRMCSCGWRNDRGIGGEWSSKQETNQRECQAAHLASPFEI
jgi:hypothetical protein